MRSHPRRIIANLALVRPGSSSIAMLHEIFNVIQCVISSSSSLRYADEGGLNNLNCG